jgi:excisionase family DNA binding protein
VNPPLMTYKEVASYMGVSERTVYRLVAQGVLRKAKIQGRTTRFRPSDVENALKEVTV